MSSARVMIGSGLNWSSMNVPILRPRARESFTRTPSAGITSPFSIALMTFSSTPDFWERSQMLQPWFSRYICIRLPALFSLLLMLPFVFPVQNVLSLTKKRTALFRDPLFSCFLSWPFRSNAGRLSGSAPVKEKAKSKKDKLVHWRVIIPKIFRRVRTDLKKIV